MSRQRPDDGRETQRVFIVFVSAARHRSPASCRYPVTSWSGGWGSFTVGGGDGICLLRVSETEEHHYGLNTTKTKPRLSGAPQSAPPSREGDGEWVSPVRQRGSLSQLLKNNKVCDAVTRRHEMLVAAGDTVWDPEEAFRTPKTKTSHFTPLLFLITRMQYTSDLF